MFRIWTFLQAPISPHKRLFFGFNWVAAEYIIHCAQSFCGKKEKTCQITGGKSAPWFSTCSMTAAWSCRVFRPTSHPRRSVLTRRMWVLGGIEWRDAWSMANENTRWFSAFLLPILHSSAGRVNNLTLWWDSNPDPVCDTCTDQCEWSAIFEEQWQKRAESAPSVIQRAHSTPSTFYWTLAGPRLPHSASR